MPHHEPVVGRRLVEERRAKRNRRRTQESTRESNEAGVASDLLNDRDTHQVPCTGTAPLESILFEGSGDIRNLVSVQESGLNFEAAADVIRRCDQGCNWGSKG
jgi:hypothetical protein